MEVKKMNTQEAIEFCDKRNILDKVLKMKIKDVKKLAKLLRQGEALKAENVELKAYKQMWKHISVIYKGHGVESDIKALEQKYFPKSVKETITKEVIK